MGRYFKRELLPLPNYVGRLLKPKQKTEPNAPVVVRPLYVFNIKIRLSDAENF